MDPRSPLPDVLIDPTEKTLFIPRGWTWLDRVLVAGWLLIIALAIALVWRWV